jgi:hypothetical protein
VRQRFCYRFLKRPFLIVLRSFMKFDVRVTVLRR